MLAGSLAGRGIGRIVSSSSLRCLQTVAPLARGLGLRVEEDASLYEGAPDAASLDRLRVWSAERVAVCSHGDVIHNVLAGLRAGGADLPLDPPAQKGSVWVLDFGTGADPVAGRYIPPPALGS